MAAKKYVWIVVPKYGNKYVVGRFSAEETAKKYVQTLNAPFNYLIKKQAVESDSEMKSNPVKKKFSPAQIAAQKLFAERARAGTLGKGKRKAAVKRKANPSTNRGLAIYLDAIAAGDTYSESKLIEALSHPSLSASDRDVIRDALKGLPYDHIRLYDAAIKIRNYKGATSPKYNEAAINKSIASSRSKISAGEGKTIKRLLMGRTGNPEKVTHQYTVFHRGTSNIAGTVRETSPKAAKEKIANRLGIPTLAYLVARKTNPDKDKPNVYIKRVSQATGASPTKRLVKRRTKALFAPAGYFPNPYTMGKSKKKANFPYCVETKNTENWNTKACFKTLAPAKEYAVALSKQYPKLAIRVMQYAGGAM